MIIIKIGQSAGNHIFYPPPFASPHGLNAVARVILAKTSLINRRLGGGEGGVQDLVGSSETTRDKSFVVSTLFLMASLKD